MGDKQIQERGLPFECFTPILPSSRYIPDNEITADKNGLPQIEKQLFLLNTRLPEAGIADRYPELMVYLHTGRTGDKPVADRYLCRNRKIWYLQENRPAAPIVCTYMGRTRDNIKPFRFILNHSDATASNVFLMMYPKGILAESIAKNNKVLRLVWEFLNSIDPDELVGHGRIYGGGLHKLEPKELRGFPALELLEHIKGH